MKILFVGNTAWSMWNFRGGVMSALQKEGWEITVVAPQDEYSPKIEAMGFNYIPLKNLDRKGLNPVKDLQLLFELFRIYRAENPKVIFHYTIKPNIWGSLALAALRLMGLSSAIMVSMVSGLGYVFIRKTWLTHIVALLYKFAFVFTRHVIFLNREDMDDFFRLNIIKRDSDKALLMNGEGVETDYFSPSPHVLPPEIPTFLFVGRLLIDKGVREFVEAACLVKAKMPNVRFQLLGAIDLGNPAAISENDLGSWVEQNLIEYLGTTEDVRPFIEKATAIVLPSYLEGLSRLLMEALAMAKPIIASNIRGCKELVDPEKNGYLVEPQNAQSLADAILKFVSLDAKEIAQYSQYSRVKSADFSLNKAILFYKNLSVFETTSPAKEVKLA